MKALYSFQLRHETRPALCGRGHGSLSLAFKISIFSNAVSLKRIFLIVESMLIVLISVQSVTSSASLV